MNKFGIAFIFLTPIVSYCQVLNIQFSKPSYSQIDSIEKFNNYKISIIDSVTLPYADLEFLYKFKSLSNKQFTKQSSPVEVKTNYLYCQTDSTMKLIAYSWDGDEKTTNIIFNQLRKNKKAISKYFKNPGMTDFKDWFANSSDWAGHISKWSNSTITVTQWFFTRANKIGIKTFIIWN